MSRAIIGVLLVTTCLSAKAQDVGCVFEANQAAVVAVEYTYKVKEGDSLEDGKGKGTGFIISPDGLVITASHVVKPESSSGNPVTESVAIRQTPILQDPIKASIVARDSANDLALLRLPARPNNEAWPTVQVATPVDLRVGAYLIAMGFPGNSDLAITPPAQKSAFNTNIDGELKPWWQTSLSLDHGNSGGPVFGSLGTVVGVAVAKSVNSQQVSWVIPISRTQHFLDFANVRPAKFGPCAVFPTCRLASKDNIERYTVDETLSQWSAWLDGGHNQPEWCDEYLRSLKSTFPKSDLSVVSSDEQSRETGLRHFEYRYLCRVRRTEGPIYKNVASEACIP